ncbi:hypothetical protein [Clostridium sp.]|uniref:hypothetical protein n=1 Tax=Clostridium sp. TaxID=1506 RepID=UPI002628264C|nr:hypothetical protein [Clostridium sp.]
MNNQLKCTKCGNETYFYREIHLIGKIRVNSKGKVLKQLSDISEGDLFKPIRCSKCNEIVVADGDIY